MGILFQDLDKTAQRFVREAVYGIMASQSVCSQRSVKRSINPIHIILYKSSP